MNCPDFVPASFQFIFSNWKFTAIIILHFHLQRSSNMNYFKYTLHHFTPHRRYDLKKIGLTPNMWFHSSVDRASHWYHRGHFTFFESHK